MLDKGKLWKQEVRKHRNPAPPSTWHPALRHLLHIVHKPKGAIFHKDAPSVMLRFPPDGTMDGVVLVWCSCWEKSQIRVPR